MSYLTDKELSSKLETMIKNAPGIDVYDLALGIGGDDNRRRVMDIIEEFIRDHKVRLGIPRIPMVTSALTWRVK